jgi:hypothetical protein
MYERHYGNNYDENLTNKQIAAKIRAWIKATYPGYKFSVTMSRGNAINCDMVECPEHHHFYAVDVCRDEVVVAQQHEVMMKEIKAYGNSFNFDGSEIMVDYFDVNFYFFPGIAWNGPAEKQRLAQHAQCQELAAA